MCGIAGVVGGNWRPAQRERIVTAMTDAMRHRGPDGAGLIGSGDCCLGFRRLAIIDVEAASPPFANESRTIWSVCNGQIYNAPELLAGLLDRGHDLGTRTDTEVVPHLYEEHGADLAQELNGMFAFAVWDSPRRRLLLGRDRAGEKPLFYWQEGDQLAFASDLRALLVHPDVQGRLDPVAVRRYLTHDYFPAPLSPIAGVRKLPAGHLLLRERGGLAVRPYWELAEHFDQPALARRRRDDLADELDERLAIAVRRRSRADVPLGLFLSGGIDSSALLSHLHQQLGQGVPVFSIGHRDRSFDEAGLAEATARRFEADFNELILDEAMLADGLRRVGAGFSEPLGDASTIPSHLLARLAGRKVKVILSGEGADELFAGYPTYIGHRVAELCRRLPAGLVNATLGAIGRLTPSSMGNVGLDYLLRRFTADASRELVERHHSWFGSLGPEIQRQVLSPRMRDRLGGDDPFGSARSRLAGKDLPDRLSEALYMDFTMYLQDDLLTKVDRATMLASIEARAPFLDHELVQFAAGLPSGMKLRGKTTKAILRRSLRRRLPAAILHRRKRGFNIPFSRWLLHGLGEELRTRFSRARVDERGLFRHDGIATLLDEHLALRADHRKPLFNLLAFDLWCDATFGESGALPLADATGFADRVTADVAS